MISRNNLIKIFNRNLISAFTLLELLIVMGVVGILATIAILVLNPTELLKQTKDSKRLSEIQTIDDAIRLYTINSSVPSYGTSSVVYLSLPDNTSQTCGSYTNLPTLTGGWTYACKPESTYRKVDGTGWIPVDFTSAQINPPLAILPVDPVNNNSFYYAYTPPWVLTTKIASEKYLSSTAQRDGGSDTNRFETGLNLSLWESSGGGNGTSTIANYQQTISNESSLVSYWKMDNNWNDSKGTNHGTAYGPTFGTAKYGAYSGSFDGTDDYVEVPHNESLNFGTGDFTFEAWVKTSHQGSQTIHSKYPTGGWNGWEWDVESTISMNTPGWNYVGTIHIDDGNWHFIVTLARGNISEIWVDGNLDTQISITPTSFDNTGPLRIGTYDNHDPCLPSWVFNGLIDEVAIYNTALSAETIAAHYAATGN